MRLAIDTLQHADKPRLTTLQPRRQYPLLQSVDQPPPTEGIAEEDAFVAKYGGAGGYEWAFGLGSRNADFGLGLAVGHDDAVYVLGSGHGAIDFDPGSEALIVNASSSSFVARYTSMGALALAYGLETPSNPGIAEIWIYPNPIRELSVVEVNMDRPADVSLVVYDILGREITRLHDGYLAPGASHRFSFDGTDFATGAYVLRATGIGINTSRVLLIRK